MKVGIITFHKALNFGAVLQAYALQKSFMSIGLECDILDYSNEHIKTIYKLKKMWPPKDLKSFLKNLLLYNNQKQKIKKFNYFCRNYLNMSKEYLTKAELIEDSDNYDFFVTGSDQVFNYNCSKFDKAYFLDFVKEPYKKNAYAASFGFDKIPPNYIDEYRKLLEGFGALSVREKQGADIIKDLIGRDAVVTLDPTLLLQKSDWDKVAQDYKGLKDYIFIYDFANSSTILSFAKKLSKEKNCDIVWVNDSIKPQPRTTFAKGIGPLEFVGLIKNARYIVTNSFHGTAFSINFNKEFFVELLPPPAHTDARLKNIMDTFGLRDRQIIDGNNNNIDKPIDYEAVNNLLNKERQASFNFLRGIKDSKITL